MNDSPSSSTVNTSPADSPSVITVASTSSAIRSRWVRTASAVRTPASESAARQVSVIRSDTSNPEFFRASCTSRITSRATPAATSSGVSSRSSATVSPCSLSTDQPSRGRSEMITSSGPISVPPSKSTVALPSRASAACSSAASADAIASATFGVCLPNRLPSARKLPLAE